MPTVDRAPPILLLYAAMDTAFGGRRLSPALRQRAGLPAARLRDQPAQDCAVSNRYNAWFKPTQSGVRA